MLASDVFLIEPRGFGANPETAASNAFQARRDSAGLEDKALVEHRRLVAALEAAGIRCTVLAPHRNDIPDAVFPNNWFSTDHAGRLIIYPMEAASRQNEIRPEIARELEDAGYQVSEVIDPADMTIEGALEGTGSLVLDHESRIAYAALSSRTHRSMVDDWCQRHEFHPCIFHATDPDGMPVYHTNVIMGIGSSLAVICLQAIDENERDGVKDALQESGREILEIDWQQVRSFAGNVLFLQGNESEIMMISRTGWSSLTPAQRETVAAHAKPVPVAVDTIESTGGGSVRCMIAELFLPRK